MRPERSTLQYRPDVDGLRAVAIALVLGYHVAPSVVPGGFVGVDVFFVVSGFLITKILVAGPGRFARFYARRVRRLAPALLLVLVATVVLGHLTLLAEAFRELAKHTAGAAMFVANVVLWLESGYFDAAAIDKPLLHLWSLGIEEQFYLFWPLTLWWLLRRPGRALWATTVVAIASFAACVMMVRVSPDAAFYLPWFRMWEPLAGALLALSLGSESPSASPLHAEWLAWTGGLLVVGSAFVLGRGASFPSWTALAPVVGTAMLIGAGERTYLARTILSWRPVVGLGLISYPLYLWHWPLISLLADSHPTVGVGSRARLCLVAILLATATYLFLERPSRTSYRRWPRGTVSALSGGMILLLVASLGLARASTTAGVTTLPELAFLEQAKFLDVELRAGLGSRPCERLVDLPEDSEVVCRITGPTETDQPILLWGDSTADSWAPLVQTVAQERGVGVVLLSFSGCPPLFGVRGPLHADCDLDDEGWKVRLIESLRPSHIVLTARWAAYTNVTLGHQRADYHYVTTAPDGPADQRSSRLAVAEKLPETISRLTQIAPVTVVASAPDLLSHLPRALLLDLEYRPSREMHREAQRQVAELLAGLTAGEPRLTVLDPAELLCASGMCTGVVGDTVVYQDDNHVSAQGSLLFRDLLTTALDAGELSRSPRETHDARR